MTSLLCKAIQSKKNNYLQFIQKGHTTNLITPNINNHLYQIVALSDNLVKKRNEYKNNGYSIIHNPKLAERIIQEGFTSTYCKTMGIQNPNSVFELAELAVQVINKRNQTHQKVNENNASCRHFAFINPTAFRDVIEKSETREWFINGEKHDISCSNESKVQVKEFHFLSYSDFAHTLARGTNKAMINYLYNETYMKELGYNGEKLGSINEFTDIISKSSDTNQQLYIVFEGVKPHPDKNVWGGHFVSAYIKKEKEELLKEKGNIIYYFNNVPRFAIGTINANTKDIVTKLSDIFCMYITRIVTISVHHSELPSEKLKENEEYNLKHDLKRNDYWVDLSNMWSNKQYIIHQKFLTQPGPNIYQSESIIEKEYLFKLSSNITCHENDQSKLVYSKKGCLINSKAVAYHCEVKQRFDKPHYLINKKSDNTKINDEPKQIVLYTKKTYWPFWKKVNEHTHKPIYYFNTPQQRSFLEKMFFPYKETILSTEKAAYAQHPEEIKLDIVGSVLLMTTTND